MNEIIVIVLNTILAKAVPQSLSKRVDLGLGLPKRVMIVMTVLLAFLRLEKSVASSKNTLGSRTSL